MPTYRSRCWSVGLCLALLWGLAETAAESAAPHAAKLKELREQARLQEKQGDWSGAVVSYDAILKLDRNQTDVRDRYQSCLRRYWQARRHGDYSYLKEVLSLEMGHALRLYGLVLDTLLDNALERKKTDISRLVSKGAEELRWALASPEFRQQHLRGWREEDLREFKDYVARTFSNLAVQSKDHAVRLVREAAVTAQRTLDVRATAVIMEFLCGACYAMDEYTAYLTPAQLRELCDAIKGDVGAVGLTLAQNGNQIVITEAAPGSHAADFVHHRIISVDKKDVSDLSADQVQELLAGPTGTIVELVLEAPDGGRHAKSLQRRPMVVASVRSHMLADRSQVGYIQITSFQQTTLHELDDALLTLAKSGMKALVLDLRGNSGGVFEAAIDAARRFLSTGIIVSTQNGDARFNTIYQAHSQAMVTVPLVVLIDGDTASAAEVLAGALKENQRARLIGQTTFGKGFTQILVRLPPGPGNLPTGGLRLTVTRFFSPTGQPYSGRGVAPHLFVDRLPMEPIDTQLDEAKLEALRLLEMAAKTTS